MDLKIVFNEQAQKSLLSKLIADIELYRELREFTDPELFDDPIVPSIRLIHEYYDAYGDLPPIDLIESQFPLGLTRQSLTDADKSMLREQLPLFARYRSFENVILDGIDLLGEGKFDEVTTRVNNAAKICKPRFSPKSLRELDWCVPPRRWLYGRSLLRGFVSILGGPGGVGKSSYAIAVGMSIVLGRALLHREDSDSHVVHAVGKVCYLNLEDSLDEIQRRVLAECRHRGVLLSSLYDGFLIDSGRDNPLVVASLDRHGNVVRSPVIEEVIKFVAENKIALLIIDPFSNCHEVTENLNDHLKIVLGQWREVADKAGCAVWALHHFKKGGQAGDADAFRGAGTLQNAARVMETFTTMTLDEAGKLGISPGDRRKYAQLKNAKANLSNATDEPEWYRFVGVDLDNATAEYKSDQIGVLDPWYPQPALHGCDMAQIGRCLDEIEQGEWKFAVQAKDKWVGHVVMRHLGLDETHAKQLLKEWEKAGVLMRAGSKNTSRVEPADGAREAIEARMKARL